ncbi:MAG: hypothetical protein H0V44_05095 [Planctomycetes bacterium]|nr:hypothetical protein [Planctomycetota bacterium]
MPLWAEPSRRVHNEILEAAVDGGILVAILLGVLLVRMSVPRSGAAPDRPMPTRDPWVAVLLWVGVVYWSMLGMLIEGNLVWWPGGTHVTGLAWAGAVAAAMVLALIVLQRAPAPPRWSLAIGILALAIHSLLDFDLHSAAIWGTLIACACLASGTARTMPVARHGRGLLTLVAMTIAVIGLAGCLAAAIPVANRVRTAHELTDRIRDAYLSQGDARERALAGLAVVLGDPPNLGGDADAEKHLLVAARARAIELAPPDRELELSLVASERPGADREPRTRRLAGLLPASGFAASCLARDHVAMAQAALAAGNAAGCHEHWRRALDLQRRAVVLAPAYTPARRTLAAMLADAADVIEADADALRREREDVIADAVRLEPIVDPKNRR